MFHVRSMLCEEAVWNEYVSMRNRVEYAALKEGVGNGVAEQWT